MLLKDKVALITGSGRGIGRAIARLFAQEGASVFLCARSEPELASAAADIGKSADYSVANLTREQDCTRLVSAARAKFAKIDILVNNAGVSHIGTVESTTEQDFDRVFRVNVKGYFNCINAVIGRMKSAGGGVILNMASVAGSAGLADRFAYSTSKGAVIAMTYSVARDYIGHNIRCNCISPARVHTTFVDGYLKKNYPGREQEMFETLAKTQPIGRMGKPDEVASLALFLCSDAASFITGVDYPLDGGFMNLHG